MADAARRAPILRDLMTTRVVVVSPDDPVADAAAAMVGRKTGSALIMQGSFLAGILTERDVLRAAASGSDLTHSPVSAWMTKDPEPASPDTTVEDAMQLMLLHGFRHLPVLEGREVRGIVSLRDLAAVRIPPALDDDLKLPQEAIDQIALALNVPCGEVHQVDSLL